MKIIKESINSKSNKLILDEGLFNPLVEDLSYYQDRVANLLSSDLVDTVEATEFNGKEAFKLTANDGKVLYLVPSTLSQVDVYDNQGNVLDTNVFWRYIVDEFIQTEEAGFVYQLVGGDCSGTYTIDELKNLPCFDGKYSADQSEIRNNGGFTHRKELDNQPELNGYLGPMFDGWDKNHNAILRYETQEVYDALSESRLTEDEPYTKEEVKQDLRSITNNFTEKEGEVKCKFEEEKDFGVKILKQHYKVVEVSGDGRREGAWYHISYAEPKNLKEGFSSNIDLDKVVIDVANLLDEEELGDNWIEVFPAREVSPYKILLEITGADETVRKAFIYSKPSDSTKVCFGFRNGSEGCFTSAEEIARFIAGEYGLSLNEGILDAVGGAIGANIVNNLTEDQTDEGLITGALTGAATTAIGNAIFGEDMNSNSINLGDTVRVRVANNRIGTVTKLIGDDLIEVEFEAEGKYPARNDRYYTSDVELLDNELTICPNCGGTRFNDNTGFCIDCGYDEKSYGDLDESKINEADYSSYQVEFDSYNDGRAAEDVKNKEIFDKIKRDWIEDYKSYVNKYKKYGLYDFNNSDIYSDKLKLKSNFDEYSQDKYSPEDFIKIIENIPYDKHGFDKSIDELRRFPEICAFGINHYISSETIKEIVPDYNEFFDHRSTVKDHYEQALRSIVNKWPDHVGFAGSKLKNGVSFDNYYSASGVFVRYLQQAYKDTSNILKNYGYKIYKVPENARSVSNYEEVSFSFAVKNIDKSDVQKIKDILAPEGIEVIDATPTQTTYDRLRTRKPEMSGDKYKSVRFSVWMPDLMNKGLRPEYHGKVAGLSIL